MTELDAGADRSNMGSGPSPATRTAMMRTDPFYPYLTPLGNSRARSSVSNKPLMFPLFRGLVQSDAGLEHRLQGLPSHFVSEFRVRNREGKSAQAGGDWERAISCFLHCKILLEARKANVEPQTYDWLLAWADLPLAQLYQLRGSAEMCDSDQRVDMLKKALTTRREILACIKTLFRSNPLLAIICEGYCYTAQYEWGCLTRSEAKYEAVQEYAELFDCDNSEAEAQLCLLLYIDHYYAGSLESSLSWIQAANRLGKEYSPDGSCYPPYFLEREVELLMRLEKFPEAVKALENLQPHASDSKSFHQLLLECYTQMSRRVAVDGNALQAEEYEQAAEIQHALIYSLNSEDDQENVFVGPSDSPLNRLSTANSILKEILFPDSGSSLGLVQADQGLEFYLGKLPAPISSIFRNHCELAKFSQECGDWKGAICEYQMGREFLKIIKKVVDKEAHDWLLTWVDLPLANLYHYRAMNFEKAVEIRQEMLVCALKHQTPAIEHLSAGYWTVLSAVEFERKYSSTSDAKYEIAQQYSKSCRIGVQRAEHDLCFWLYFGHYLHGSLETSLKWLQEAKRLQEQRDPDRKCSSFDYFCCIYDYLRCEADLLMKLQRFELAASSLEVLLETRHVHQGSPRLEREARQWLQECYMQMRRNASADEGEMADLQRALECSLIADNHQQEGTADQLPFLTGCFKLTNKKLVQSKAGLEQHLHKLPPPIHLAFRKHSDLALLMQGVAEWETTTFQFEWCREILKLSRTRIEKETYDWLLVWANLPLAQIYQFQKMQLRKALDMWSEMFFSIPLDTNEQVIPLVGGYLYAAMYQCAISDSPHLKDMVVKTYGSIMKCLDDWVSEECLLIILHDEYWASSNYEASLHFTRAAKSLFEHNFSGDRPDKKNAYVFKEARSLICLGRFEDAKEVLNEYTGGLDGMLDQRVDILRKSCYRKDTFDAAQMELSGLSDPLLQLRRQSVAFEEKEQYEEAVKCHMTCLDMIDKLFNASGGLDIAALHHHGHRPGFYDNYRLGVLYMMMSFRSMSCFSCAQLTGRPCPDENFLRAAKYFERSIELSLSLTGSQDVAHINLLLLQLYEFFDTVYGSYLLTLFLRTQNETTDFAASLKILFSEIREYLTLSGSNEKYETNMYLNLPNLIEKYGRQALLQYSSSLYSTERYSENYIEVLDNHKILYAHLQRHLYRRAFFYHVYNGSYVLGLTSKDYEETVQFCKWKAFVYAEGERTRVMLYQLLPSKRLNYDASRQLWGFDFDEEIAMKDIQETCAILFKGDTVFVQYSRSLDDEAYIIYVIDQDGKLSMTHTRMDDELTSVDGPKRSTLDARLKNLHNYIEGRRVRRGYNEDSMKRDLEFLYDMLIKPIAAYLDKMKPEQKLILAPSELLTKVPFAALRDSSRQPGQRYLIERHTISFTSSLRVLRVCNDRLQDLQCSEPLYACRGSVIALGDPEYAGMYDRLEDSGKEVSYMASLFGESAVVKLLKEDASAKQLKLWAEKPSHNSFRQAIIHIGAHGVVNEEDHTKSFLRLARPASSSSAHGNENHTLSSRGKQLDDEQEEDDYSSEEIEIEVNNEAGTSSTVETSMFPLLINRRFQWKYPGSSIDAIRKPSRSGPSMRKNDYDLTAEDISGSEMKWRAELVVLSACRTAQGKRTAEGVLSLTRAFMIAGVPCVVASQWEVLDGATCDLMRHFYLKLRTGNEDVATSLRSSMLKMLEDNHPVRAWAPFAVWGAPTLRIPHCLQRPSSADEEMETFQL